MVQSVSTNWENFLDHLPDTCWQSRRRGRENGIRLCFGCPSRTWLVVFAKKRFRPSACL